jgi:hypothetical protein
MPAAPIVHFVGAKKPKKAAKAAKKPTKKKGK